MWEHLILLKHYEIYFIELDFDGLITYISDRMLFLFVRIVTVVAQQNQHSDSPLIPGEVYSISLSIRMDHFFSIHKLFSFPF